MLIMSIFFTAQAGYVIRGIDMSITPSYYDLKNYTLTFNQNGEPVSAASVHMPIVGGGNGRNTIVIVTTEPPILPLPPSICFPIPGFNEDFDIEVRDFHYIPEDAMYVLCGSRKTNTYSHAFLAKIDGGLTTMTYNEYSEADIFYSIWEETLALNYYVCGKKGNHGVIASIYHSNLRFTNFYTTTDDQEWEYHKIIAKYNNNQFLPHLVASGRKPDCTEIGFTVFDPSFTTINSYRWVQDTEPLSHCVVSDNLLENDAIVLASSYLNTVTLNLITFPLSIMVGAYRFTLPGIEYNIQDVGTFQLSLSNLRISVAGFKRNPTIDPLRSVAWHGYYMIGYSPVIGMINNDYYGPYPSDYEHYKIRYHEDKEYTGGYFQNYTEQCALFGTPLTLSDCDNIYHSNALAYHPLQWVPFYLTPHTPEEQHIVNFNRDFIPLYAYYDCPLFKEEEPEPDLVMPFEPENEIITYYDRITVKDTPENTRYQIYSITGQLLQTGATHPDISTAQLSKGIYILRLENGKVVKFVK